jgi:hypothetical protein
MRARDAVLVALGLSLVVPACRERDALVQPAGGAHATGTPEAAAVAFPSDLYAQVRSECVHCHSAAPFPADIDLTTASSLLPSQVQMLYDGVASESAPAAGAPLVRSTYTALLDWAVANGAQHRAVQVPATAAWTMAEQLAGAAVGSSAVAPGRFFGFRIEDLRRTSSLLVDRHTDAAGQTHTGIALVDQQSVDPDSFTSSTHPVNYVVIDGLEWNGRWRQLRFSGYMVIDRWAFIAFHIKLLEKGPSPNGSRRQRHYVRLQIDRDWMSWRSKVPPADGIETYPWSGADPSLTAAPGWSLNAATGYLNQTKWYYVEGSITEVGGVMRYLATLRDAATGATICGVGADRQGAAEAYGSTAFGKYSESGSSSSGPKKTRFADWTFQVDDLYGGGATPPVTRLRRPHEHSP